MGKKQRQRQLDLDEDDSYILSETYQPTYYKYTKPLSYLAIEIFFQIQRYCEDNRIQIAEYLEISDIEKLLSTIG